MDIYAEFYGPNAGYVLDLYERFLQDPNSVDPDTRRAFESQPPRFEAAPRLSAGASAAGQVDPVRAAAAVRLGHAIRIYGHLAAHLDPLGSPPPGDPWLEASFHGLAEGDLARLPAAIIGGPGGETGANALEAIQALRKVYSGGIGYEYGHIRIPEERQWLRDAAEFGRFRPPQDPIDPLALLDRLTQVEAFEQFLHRIFPGKTRFSIEGVDMLVPMLDDFLGSAAEHEICTAIIAMAHRGRLNVLAHILGKPYDLILAEFKDPISRSSTGDELGWTGDVKYHKGARHAIQGGDVTRLIVGMPPNPSHLEHVDPVALGMARSAGSKVDRPGPPEFFPNAALPVLIHGDAAFPGQGVVAETLNLSRLEGYSVGGTLHIITNNQLGYTAGPEDVRSTLYASDLAKGFQIPIIHVNADDPPACIEAARTAFAYRQKFKKDFLIDLIGYRRYGHNEGDEPSFTQPLMYEKIASHPPVRKVWADILVGQGTVEASRPDEMLKERMNALQEVLAGLDTEMSELERRLSPQLAVPPSGAARRVETGVPQQELIGINEAILKVPDGFHLNRKIERSMQRRKDAFQDPDAASIDWAAAEELALASILADGIPIRMTGEDTQRGTFSHRHAVFHDVENGGTYTPLQSFPQAKASFEIIDSPLSENAAIGFEFGYDVQDPTRLVIWEAQYGDFINTAQAMIDEFLLSGRAKWEQTPGLVLLLPHGYEGQGPDHSSGRPERFLELADQDNLRLANCTTAAQFFHLLRRQAALLQVDPLPLIVLTPKSLLRHPLVASTPRDLAEGRWQPVIDDPQARQDPEAVRRLVFCSGKVYVDLVSNEQRGSRADLAIARLEQWYPFPEADVRGVFEGYPNLQELVWLQEEPANMGAWPFIRALLEDMVEDRIALGYIGRDASASPAEGSAAWHASTQKELIAQVFQPEEARVKEGE